jgi:hypothetical protein
MAKFVVESVEGGMVTLKVPSMNYRNSFMVKGATGADLGAREVETRGKPAPLTATGPVLKAGERVSGRIVAPAWKVDRVEMGGNYVEPLVGRPRRMQGMVLAVDGAKNELTVQVGYEVTVKLPEKYRASDYQVGERVGWDNVEVPVLEVSGQLSGVSGQ